MTEEQVKFYFNAIYRLIIDAPNGISFGELIEYANKRKLDDDLFMDMLDDLEMTIKVVKRDGETYSRL